MVPRLVDVQSLAADLRRFARQRDWEQFHTPKNLAMALAAEAGELLEPFQWLSAEESKALGPKPLAAVADEIADVLIYLVRLADVLAIDVNAAVITKLNDNERRYPVERFRGTSAKAPG